MLTPYLIEVESQGETFPHVFYANDAEDAVCGATDYLRTTWRAATILSARRLSAKEFGKAIGRAEVPVKVKGA